MNKCGVFGLSGKTRALGRSLKWMRALNPQALARVSTEGPTTMTHTRIRKFNTGNPEFDTK
jgi:hypothetical protein